MAVRRGRARHLVPPLWGLILVAHDREHVFDRREAGGGDPLLALLCGLVGGALLASGSQS